MNPTDQVCGFIGDIKLRYVPTSPAGLDQSRYNYVLYSPDTPYDELEQGNPFRLYGGSNRRYSIIGYYNGQAEVIFAGPVQEDSISTEISVVPEESDGRLMTSDGSYDGTGAGMSNSRLGTYVTSVSVEGDELVVRGSLTYYPNGYSYNATDYSILPEGIYRFILTDSLMYYQGEWERPMEISELSERLENFPCAPGNTVIVENGVVVGLVMTA